MKVRRGPDLAWACHAGASRAFQAPITEGVFTKVYRGDPMKQLAALALALMVVSAPLPSQFSTRLSSISFIAIDLSHDL